MSDYLAIVRRQDCTGCGACSAICPHQCIALNEDERGFRMPFVDLTICVNCGLCKKVCPVLNELNKEELQTPKLVVAAKNPNKLVAENSSSGGVFSILAEYVIEQHGAVYVVILNDELQAVHIRIDNAKGLYRLRCSKYLQSDSSEIYPEVKKDLQSGKSVLFSGTPCQIAALKQYLHRDFSNLICIAVVCHGVPSGLVFREYVSALEIKYNSKIIGINFRDKSKGWGRNRICFQFANGKQYSQFGENNLLMQAYIKNLSIRDSCLNCKFKEFKSGADFILGDLWGVEQILPQYKVSNGVSMMCINTSKGICVYNDIKNRLLDCDVISYEDVKKYNACIYSSVKGHIKREEFLDNLNSLRIIPDLKMFLGITRKTIIKTHIQQLKIKLVSFLVSIRGRI